jgi:hypothetical protein
MLGSSPPSRPSSPSPPQQTQDVENLRLRRKISALEATVDRLESTGGSTGGSFKRRYEYAVNKGMKLTFDLILPAGRLLRISPDVESVRLRIYIMT